MQVLISAITVRSSIPAGKVAAPFAVDIDEMKFFDTQTGLSIRD